jgi:hypothetical protein
MILEGNIVDVFLCSYKFPNLCATLNQSTQYIGFEDLAKNFFKIKSHLLSMVPPPWKRALNVFFMNLRITFGGAMVEKRNIRIDCNLDLRRISQ